MTLLAIDWGDVLFGVLVVLAILGSVILVTATHRMHRKWRGKR